MEGNKIKLEEKGGGGGGRKKQDKINKQSIIYKNRCKKRHANVNNNVAR